MEKRRRRNPTPSESATPELTSSQLNPALSKSARKDAPSEQAAESQRMQSAAGTSIPRLQNEPVRIEGSQKRQKTNASKKSPDSSYSGLLRFPKFLLFALQSACHPFSNLPGKRKAGQSTKKRSNGKHGIGSGIAYAVLMVTAIFSFVMIGRIAHRSIRTAQLNESLSKRHAQIATEGLDTSNVIIFGAQEAEETAAPAPISTAVIPSASEQELTAVTAPEPTPVTLVTATKYHEVGGEALPEMAALYADNSDLVGWINISGILDQPVVYKNNTFYLTHDFYQRENTAGTLFLDVNHPFREKTQNLLLHGHNMRDGSMFGRLVQYKSSITYLKNHSIVDFSSIWSHEEYVIFSVFDVSLDPDSSRYFNYYTHSTFKTDEEFSDYIGAVKTRSLYAIPVDVQPGDALMTLSTCLDDDRLVILARRKRENETTAYLSSLVATAQTQ